MVSKKQTELQNAKIEELTRELYDILMEGIEPDLMTENLPHLNEIYQDETTEQRKARGEHYKWAYEQFGKLWGTFIEQTFAGFSELKETLMEQYKTESAQEEKETMESLESELDELDATQPDA